MDCEDVLDQLAEYLDEEARGELCRAIEEHLTQCRHCRLEVDTVRKTIVLYQAERGAETPHVASSRLAAALAKEYRGGKS